MDAAPIICISDSHLGYRHRSKKDRLKDYEKAFEESLEKALSLKPTVIVFCGDLLHHPKPEPIAMKKVVQGLLRAAEKCPVIVVIGNHEISGHLSTTYTPIYSDLHENIHVLSTDSPHVKLSVSGKTIGFHGFQYIRNRDLAEKTLRETSKETGGCDFDILCLHQAIEGYLAPHEISRACLREVAPKFNLMLFGHVHKHQKIAEVFDVCPAYYVGSTERISFNEWENTTGFMAFENMDFANPQFIEVSSARMRRVTLDLGEKNPQELNVFIESKIRENSDAQLLQVEVKADVAGDILDVRRNWAEQYPTITVLDVNLAPKTQEADIVLERLELSSDTIREYFSKTGLKGQDELLETCIGLFEEHAR
ncbi:MAG: metallophosphoesterase [Candidatus Altiarchaeota archaeon]